MERKNKSDTSDTRGNLNHLKIIQKVPEKYTGKARNQKTEKTAILDIAQTFWKYECKSTKYLTWEITLHVA